MDLSITDLSDDHNLVDAEHELNRAELAAEGGEVAPMLAWFRKWARPALTTLRDLADAPPHSIWGED